MDVKDQKIKPNHKYASIIFQYFDKHLDKANLIKIESSCHVEYMKYADDEEEWLLVHCNPTCPPYPIAVYSLTSPMRTCHLSLSQQMERYYNDILPIIKDYIQNISLDDLTNKTKCHCTVHFQKDPKSYLIHAFEHLYVISGDITKRSIDT